MGILGFYLDFPAWVRAIIAALVLGAGIWMCIDAWRGRQTYEDLQLPDGQKRAIVKNHEDPFAHLKLPLGLLTSAIGAALFGACGRSDAEKHGYKF